MLLWNTTNEVTQSLCLLLCINIFVHFKTWWCAASFLGQPSQQQHLLPDSHTAFRIMRRCCERLSKTILANLHFIFVFYWRNNSDGLLQFGNDPPPFTARTFFLGKYRRRIPFETYMGECFWTLEWRQNIWPKVAYGFANWKRSHKSKCCT